MDWQQSLALSIVAMTAGGFVWARFRPRKPALARTSHCGCHAPGRPGTRDSVVFRARRGEKPQVIFKSR